MLTALPRIDGSGDPASLATGIEQLIERVTEAWTGPAGPKLRLLPELITFDELRGLPHADPAQILLGVDETDLAPYGLDPRTDPHLFLYGDAGSGNPPCCAHTL